MTLADFESEFDVVYGVAHIYTTLDDQKVVDANDKVMKDFDEFNRQMQSNKALYDVFNGWKKQAQKYTDWARLTHEDKTFVNKVLDEFKRAGIEQSEKVKS